VTEVELRIVAEQWVGDGEPSDGRYARGERVVGWRGHVGVRLAGRSEVRDGAEGHWSCGREGDGERVEDVDRRAAPENRLGKDEVPDDTAGRRRLWHPGAVLGELASHRADVGWVEQHGARGS
jgi:hypothetical protein